MVLLKELNKICANRNVSKNFPAQIVCRLFGNKNTTCKLDKLCETAEKKGIWYFYTPIIIFLLIVYIILFWLLRLTKLSKIFYPLSVVLLIPLEWLAICFAATYRFIRKLPFY